MGMNLILSISLFVFIDVTHHFFTFIGSHVLIIISDEILDRFQYTKGEAIVVSFYRESAYKPLQ